MNARSGGSPGRARFRVGVIIEPVYSGSTLVGYAKVTRDITEKYNAIQHLREAEHALAQSRRIEAIGKLTLGISHDFNNILSVILGSLDLIGKGEQDPRRLKLLSTAAKAAERGSQLSARMLAFARGQNLSPDIHDVHTLISDSKGVLSRSAGPVPCSMHMGASSSVVRIDAAQFMAALANLVVNARDAGDVTGMRITTTVRHPDMHLHVDAKANTRYLWTSVADNGPGMSEETQARDGALLHHQGRRQRERAWLEPGVRVCSPVGGLRQHRERGRRRDDGLDSDSPVGGYRWSGHKCSTLKMKSSFAR